MDWTGTNPGAMGSQENGPRRGGLRIAFSESIDAGVTAGMVPDVVRVIRLINIWAFSTFFFYEFYAAYGIWIGSTVFTAASTIAAGSHIAVMVCLKRRLYNAASLIFITCPAGFVVFATVYLPEETYSILFFVMILFAVFLDTPVGMWRKMVWVVVTLCALCLGMFYLSNRYVHVIGLPRDRLEVAAYSAIFGTMLGLAALGFIARYTIRISEGELLEERRRTEGLLMNILPEKIVCRLKEHPGAIADEYPGVTIMFADIVDFTRLASGMAPEEVVDFLNSVFSMMDNLADRRGLEKVKTIGDAYMVAAGVPEPRPDHVEAIAEMALDISWLLENLEAPDGSPVKLRIGINTGAVAAGVIGRRKFAYDIWGDTVNMASRMESGGVDGEIQVTEAVVSALQGRYRFEYRGEMDVKGVGAVRTWLLKGRAAG
ncbi:MAG: adenylate/guanylate cyclase domain-containing protein [Myxococcota bacterium]|jgi:class 3 adenylate cyclase